MTITLTYWDLRGMGEPARLLLRYKDADYVDNRLTVDMEGFGKWISLKDQDDLLFGNLPFIEDDGKKISQSLTIMRHLGRKFDLFPTDADDLLLCEIVEQEIYDLKNKLTSVCYDPYQKIGPNPGSEKGVFDYEYRKAAFTKRLTERIPKFDKLLTKTFLIGDSPTYVDFLLYEYLDHLRRFAPAPFEGCSNVSGYMARFEGLANLKEWFSSDEYKAGQYINAPMAIWHGGKK